MEKIKNICRDLGRAFTIGLLSGGAAAAVLLLGEKYHKTEESQSC